MQKKKIDKPPRHLNLEEKSMLIIYISNKVLALFTLLVEMAVILATEVIFPESLKIHLDVLNSTEVTV